MRPTLSRAVVAAAAVGLLAACTVPAAPTASTSPTSHAGTRRASTPHATTPRPTSTRVTPRPTATSARPTPRPTATPSGGATSVPPAPSATAASGPLATQVLATLTVRPAGSGAGYSRAAFGPAYSDRIDASVPSARNGCDQRNDVRRRDAVRKTIKRGTGGCVVSTATFLDPYTGSTISLKASGFEHVVALKDAWISGASALPAATRADIAGDPLNLLIVTATVNSAKGDKSAAVWLPPNQAFRCAYVARQVAVKARYRLSVTPAEHGRMAAQLATCPRTKVPTEADVAPPEPRG